MICLQLHNDYKTTIARNTITRHNELTRDFQKLHNELKDKGYFTPSILHVLLCADKNEYFRERVMKNVSFKMELT